MGNYRYISGFNNRNKHEPVINAMDIAREFGIQYSKLHREMKKNFNLVVVFTRRNAKYYNAKEFREWVVSNGLAEIKG